MSDTLTNLPPDRKLEVETGGYDWRQRHGLKRGAEQAPKPEPPKEPKDG